MNTLLKLTRLPAKGLEEMTRRIAHEVAYKVAHDIAHDVAHEVSHKVAQDVAHEVAQVVAQTVAQTVVQQVTHIVTQTPMTSCEDSEEEVVAVVRRRRRVRVVIEPEPMEYKPEQIKEMNDFELAKHFMRITGCKELHCNHCKGCKPIVPNWIQSIRKRCMKKDGLWSGMKVPKTCDAQQARNSTCNPINNPTYSKLRSYKFTEEEKQHAIENREKNIKLIGLEPKPYRYKQTV